MKKNPNPENTYKQAKDRYVQLVSETKKHFFYDQIWFSGNLGKYIRSVVKSIKKTKTTTIYSKLKNQ